MHNTDTVRGEEIAKPTITPSSAPTAEVAHAQSFQCEHPVPAEPLFPNWRTWLVNFYSHRPTALEGDALGTTFVSFGATILCATASSTRDESEIADVIQLPVVFVRYVLNMLGEHNLWESVELLDLQRTLATQPNDLTEVGSSLEWAEENIWNACATPDTVAELIALRAGRQVGGGADTWVDEAGYDGWGIN